MESKLRVLASSLEGELHYDALWRRIFATDASVYREIPTAVAYPKNISDLRKLIDFAAEEQTHLIPRTAGTSLAGQCVGNGIVVDVSKFFTEVLEVDTEKRQVRVQPGVIRDDLNRRLQVYQLFFGPNTSTSNRCMIGGMVGNNSSGTTSIRYGVTRDKVISLKVLLSDGSEATFSEISEEEFQEKLRLQNREGEIYRGLFKALQPVETRQEIFAQFPKPSIHRRNTGYAVDLLAASPVFDSKPGRINVAQLLCGSEGTLAFTTEITLALDPLPPKNAVMIAAHFSSVDRCLQAVVPSMRHQLFTCEMMDKVILDCTKNNLKYRENRFFIEGDPAGVLMLELRSDDELDLANRTAALLQTLRETGLAYALPVLQHETIDLALELRKAGLGLLGNMVGDRKTVACIEDTAVAVEDLADYIREFSDLMKEFSQEAVYYAHAGAGELHLRPILNLKKSKDVRLFRDITRRVALLVKKYRGSFSGEHGDGRVRAEFLELMIGESNYSLLRTIKRIFDPHDIFNPGKITDAPPMDHSLRYVPDRKEPQIPTVMDFSDSMGILRGVENCNGSGDCRKPSEAGGTMCPSYRATRNEKDTTRARANALREFLTHSENENRFAHEELREVLDLCISCKGCKSECPSNVDMAAYKAEFQFHYQKAKGKSLRSRAFAYNSDLNRLAAIFPGVSNRLFRNRKSAGVLKKILGIAPERSMPEVARQPFRSYYKKHKHPVSKPLKKVYLFADEFTNYLEPEIGRAALELLTGLRYEVELVQHPESGRSMISKGFLDAAKRKANENVRIFKDLVSEETPLIGLEPSAILSFRDEYLRLADDKEAARSLSQNVLLLEEFFKKEMLAGNIASSAFTDEEMQIKLHGHCHQKALSNIENAFAMLNLPQNFSVRIISSGCCGMAGSFGYEQEHYQVSMAIGEQSLFPAVRKAAQSTLIAASGTSCRQQIIDGTGKRALHPVQIMARALVQKE